MQRIFDALFGPAPAALAHITKFLLSKIIARRSPADAVQERSA